MAREFSRAFYRSKEWRKVREYVFNRDLGLCTKCGRPGEEVHHMEWLTPDNINNPDVTLNTDKLVTLCKDCHMDIHKESRCKSSDVTEGLMFDEIGNLVEK